MHTKCIVESTICVARGVVFFYLGDWRENVIQERIVESIIQITFMIKSLLGLPDEIDKLAIDKLNPTPAITLCVSKSR